MSSARAPKGRQKFSKGMVALSSNEAILLACEFVSHDVRLWSIVSLPCGSRNSCVELQDTDQLHQASQGEQKRGIIGGTRPRNNPKPAAYEHSSASMGPVSSNCAGEA